MALRVRTVTRELGGEKLRHARRACSIVNRRDWTTTPIYLTLPLTARKGSRITLPCVFDWSFRVVFFR